MENKKVGLEFLKFINTRELLRELGRRLNIQYGKVEMKFHRGEPAVYANIDRRVELEGEEERETKV